MRKLQDTKSISVFPEEEGEDGGRVDGLRVVCPWGCIRNTSTNAEVLTEHQLRTGGVPDQGKGICGPRHNSAGWRKGRRRRRRVNRTWPATRSQGAEAGERAPQPVNWFGQKRSIRANSCGWHTCREGDKTTTEPQGHSDKGRGRKTFPSAV